MRRIISLSFLSVVIIAGFTVKPRPAEAGDLPSRAGAFVNAMGTDVVAIMADGTITKAQKLGQFRIIFKQAFDSTTISSFALGRFRSLATPDQELECQKQIEEMMVRSYYAHFNTYGGGSFRITAIRADSDRDAFVMTEVLPLNGKPIEIEWRVRERSSHLGIIDVAVEGVSMSVTQRQEFSSVIMSNGGNIDAFLQVLRNNNIAEALSEP